MRLFAGMWLTMATTGTSNAHFTIYTTSGNTILKICQIGLLNIMNKNMWLLFDNKQLFFLYIPFILN